VRTKIFIADSMGVADDEVADYTQFDGIVRRRNVGSWSIKMQTSTKSQQLSTPGARIIVERDGQPLITGPMIQSEPKWSESEDSTVISGLTDDQALWDQIVYPCDPNWSAVDGKVFPDDAYDVRSGVCETVLKAYVVYNFAATDRRVPGFSAPSIATDGTRGTSVIGRGRFQILGDLLTELAIAGGDLDFHLRAGTFDIYVPRDLRALQVFSVESGNLQEYSFAAKGPMASDVINAGGGQDVNRVFVRRRNTTLETLWGRHIEVFKDARDTTDLGELAQRGNQALSDGAPVTTVDLRALDVPNRAFGVDWQVSDYVTVGDIPAVVNEAKITLDQDGETIVPTVGSVTTVMAQSMITLYDSVRRINRRVNALERNL
jgi:hypothetical protein